MVSLRRSAEGLVNVESPGDHWFPTSGHHRPYSLFVAQQLALRADSRCWPQGAMGAHGAASLSGALVTSVFMIMGLPASLVALVTQVFTIIGLPASAVPQ